MARTAYHVRSAKRGEIALVYFYPESTLEVWDVRKRSRVGDPFPLPSGAMLSALFGNVLCFSGGDQGGMQAVDLGSGKRLWEQAEVSELMSLAVHEAGHLLFCNCGVGRVVVLDALTGRIVAESPDLGECFCDSDSPVLVAGDGERVRFCAWPSFESFDEVECRSFAMLGAQFAGEAMVYSEVKSGVTFARMDRTRGMVLHRHVADGHFIALGYHEDERLFVGLDIMDDPNRLLFFHPSNGEVVRVLDGWRHHGEFVDGGRQMLTREGTLVDVMSGEVRTERLFG